MVARQKHLSPFRNLDADPRASKVAGRSLALLASFATLTGLAGICENAPNAQPPEGQQICAQLNSGARAFLDELILDMLDPESDFSHLNYLGEPEMKEIQSLDMDRRKSDWGNLCQYRDDNMILMTGPAPKVVFLGDSITEFWSIGDPDLFEQGFINRGISGQTSSQMLVRFWQDVIRLQPEVVHIMAGTNDLAENTGYVSDEAFKGNIEAMVTLARSHGIGVILASIPPAGSFGWRPDLNPPERISALNQWIEEYSAQNGLVFVDYHSLLTDDGAKMSENLTHDGVHPHREGYARMHEAALQAIAKAQK